MAAKIAFFGPMACGKSHWLNHVKATYPDATCIEMDSLTLDKPTATNVASALHLCQNDHPLFITAGKNDAIVLKLMGFKVVRLLHQNKTAYLADATLARPTVPPQDLGNWYDLISALPPTLFEAEIVKGNHTPQADWNRIIGPLL